MPKRVNDTTDMPAEKKARAEVVQVISNATSEQIIATKEFLSTRKDADDNPITDAIMESLLAAESAESLSKDLMSTVIDFMMPPYGPADTFEGEVLRAVVSLEYRFCNDGEYCWDYETSANNAFTFLSAKESKLPSTIVASLHEVDGLVDSFPVKDDDYNKPLESLKRNTVFWCIEAIKNGRLTFSNADDYLKWHDNYSDRKKEAIIDFMLDKMSETPELNEIMNTYEVKINIDM